MTVDIKLKPKIEVMVRLRLLHYVVDEFSKAIGINSRQLEIIKMGIIDRQIIEKIFFRFLDETGKLVGEAIVEIDWERHAVNARAGSGDSFHIDSSKSVMDQVSSAFTVVSEHVRLMKEVLDVKSLVVAYTFKHEVYSKADSLAEARRYLGLAQAPKEEWQTSELYKKRLETLEIELTPEMLDELRIVIRHNKNR